VQLRPYQEADLERVRARLRAGVKRVLLQQPTGAGKTILSGTMLGGAAERSKRSWFVVHRRELLDQTSEKLTLLDVPHGFMAAGYPVNGFAPVQLCAIDTLARRLHEAEAPDFIVPDEAHHMVAATWARCLTGHDAYTVGLTATPERLDGRGLKDHFDELIVGPSVKQLIADGWLSTYRYFAPGQPDLAGVRVLGGDFNRGDIAKVMGTSQLIGDVVATYLKLAEGLQGIVFAVDVQSAIHIAAAFNAAGITAAAVSGETPQALRKMTIDRFRAGDIQILTNCELFGEGFDVPNVSYVGLARPTQSLALHLQQVGRALRVVPGKSCAVICDHAGNAFRHGLPDDDREWTLEGRKRSKRGAKGPSDALPIRQCTECYRVSPSSADHCPGCGVVFPARVRLTCFAEGELFELERIEAKRREKEARKAEERACQSLEDWMRLGKQRGYKSGWAIYQWKLRQRWRRTG
jgi:superfamily II DNA or RNA helicase